MNQEQNQTFINNSPWLYQLKRTRPIASLADDLDIDVVIIGGGIAGVATAWYALKNTNQKVALIEANKIAHAATGHNAGQLVSYFERPFSDIVKEFGLTKSAEGQKAIESAWALLDGIFNEAQLHTPLSQFTGYAASKDMDEVLGHIKNNSFRLKAGLSPALIMIAEEAKEAAKIPKRYNSTFAFVSHKDILGVLETDDKRYIAALPSRKGCMNSALFCEELIGYMLTKYKERFLLAEDSAVEQIVLEKDTAQLKLSNIKVLAKKVILCTNGFETISIVNKAGKDINTKFHHMVRGSVGYMAGYLDDFNRPPTSISYLPQKQKTTDAFNTDPYFYLTRRLFEGDTEQVSNLICIGGPEALLDDTNAYRKEHPYPNEAQDQIDSFLKQTYKYAPKGKIDYKFKWHGLMGYTPTGVRVIGPEPRNPILYYNLGCNGVGLLHSIYGGMKISQYLQSKKLKPSIFDPKN